MRRTVSRFLLSAVTALGLFAGVATAEDAPAASLDKIPAPGEKAAAPAEPAPPAKEEPKPEPCRKNVVPGIACWAKPGFTRKEDGYYVGGGCLYFGRGPNGTGYGVWGWDYIGCVPKRIMLKFCDRCKYQGGTGAYKTDGPERPKGISEIEVFHRHRDE